MIRVGSDKMGRERVLTKHKLAAGNQAIPRRQRIREPGHRVERRGTAKRRSKPAGTRHRNQLARLITILVIFTGFKVKLDRAAIAHGQQPSLLSHRLYPFAGAG